MATTAAQESARPVSTLSALRNANFRLYFAGQLVSTAGTWMQNVAQGFLVFQLTHSEWMLGIVACAAGLPLFFLSPVVGIVVERVPRRTLMLCTQTVQMLLAFVLTALVVAQLVQVWHIVLLAFLLGMTNALDAPARQTFVVEMVGREDLHSGIALNSIMNSASRVLGPAAAGIALVTLGTAWCFMLNGLSFFAVIVSLLLMKVPYAIRYTNKRDPIQQIKEGVAYARHHEQIFALLLLTAIIGLFALPIMPMFAAFADKVLHSPGDGLSWLSIGQGIGSVTAGVLFSWFIRRLGHGRLIALMVILGAAATVGLAYQTTIPMATVLSVLSGLFVVAEIIGINTLLQTLVSDEFRGRILSLYTLAFFGFAPFGALALGAIADQIGVANGLALYGVICGVFSAAILWRWPVLMHDL